MDAHIRFLICLAFSCAAAAPTPRSDRPADAGEPTPGSTVPATAASDPGPPPDEAPTLAGARVLLSRGEYEAALAQYESIADSATLRADAADTSGAPGASRAAESLRDAQLGIARCHERVGRYEDAERVLAATPAGKDAERWVLLAHLDRLLGRYVPAIDRAEAATRLDPDHAGARLLLGETLELVGRRDDAIEAYAWFDRRIAGGGELPSNAEWLTDAARGFLRYSVLTRTSLAARTRHALHEMLQPAYARIDRLWWPARIAAADLLRERFNNDESDGSVSDYDAALRINPNLPEAHVGLGEVALIGWNFEEVERRTDQALAIHPRFAPALHLLAKKLVVERRYDQAIEACDRALAINPRDVIALSISAGASACRFDSAGVEARRAEVAEINPRCALFDRFLGDALSGIRQYADSERAYERAIEFDPTDANARTELGMMYMQWGLEDRARTALDAAWALDPFNERTKFTLELLDQIEHFARVETEHFVVRYDAERDRGLGEYAAGYLEEIYEQVTGDYPVVLERKTEIEFFPTHRAFGVRITGKPWIHTVGACTGSVIAMDSPRKSPQLQGPYNFVNVIKHEFTHTVTLAATRNRIPHWFTEGLAVYQEDTPRSFEWCELLADAYRRDALFTLTSIDWGFMRPRRPNDRQLAYAQSEWMCEFIVDRFGFDAIGEMLTAFRDGDTQDAVLRKRFEMDSEGFDAAFRAWAGPALRAWGFDPTPCENVEGVRLLAEQSPDNAVVQGRLALAEWDAQNYDAAASAAARALELDEREPNGLRVAARLTVASIGHATDPQERRALEAVSTPMLEKLLDVDPDGWLAPRALAEIALRDHNDKRAAELYRRLQRVCPMDPASWRGLAGIYLTRGDDDAALPQLIELARLDANDYEVPAEIARICRKQDRPADARYWLRQALAINPLDPALHRDLAVTCTRMGDTAAALREYRSLTELEPDRAEHFEAAAFAAHKLGDGTAARAFAERAVAIQPSSAAKSLLAPAKPD